MASYKTYNIRRRFCPIPGTTQHRIRVPLSSSPGKLPQPRGRCHGILPNSDGMYVGRGVVAHEDLGVPLHAGRGEAELVEEL